MKSKAPSFRILTPWVWQQTWQTHPALTTAVIALALIRSLLPAAIALIGKELIDALVIAIGQANGDMSGVWVWLVIGFSLALVEAGAANAQEYGRLRLNDELAITVTNNLMNHLATLDLAFFERPSSQNIIELAYKHSAERVATFIHLTLTVITTSLQAISLLLILLVIEPLVSLILLGLALPYLFYYTSLTRERYTQEQQRTTKRRWLNYYISLVIHPQWIPEVKLLTLPPYIVKRCHQFLQGFRDENKQLLTKLIRGRLLFTAVTLIAFYILLLRTASRATIGILTVGDVVIFVGAMGRLRTVLQTTAQAIGDLREQILYINNLYQLLDTKPAMLGRQIFNADHWQGNIQLQNVSFQYAETDKLVLADISLAITPGETIALVGENGAGKTTLAKLIAQLYTPTTGTISIGGQNLNDYEPTSWQQYISVVFQNFNRYEATVADNIAYGHWQQLLNNDEQITAIAQSAGVHQLIANTPQGYHTMLGRRFGDYNFSTGQWQKLAIARALARPHSKLIILDEPAAHLDAYAESTLFTQFRKLAANRTTILISHRLATARLADRIFVLHQGRLIEKGTHTELIVQNGHYASLYRTQQETLNNESL